MTAFSLVANNNLIYCLSSFLKRVRRQSMQFEYRFFVIKNHDQLESIWIHRFGALEEDLFYRMYEEDNKGWLMH